MNEFLPRERCPNCHDERKVRGLPCTVCGHAAPNDCELCPRCGVYKAIVGRCNSAVCVADRFLPSEAKP